MPSVKHSWKTIHENVGSTPTMVLSVIGDSDNFVPKPWAKTAFQTALIEAAKSGGESWILYRGHRTGVSNIIREAYQNYDDIQFGTVNVNYKPDNCNTIKPKIKNQVNDADRRVKLIRIAGNQTLEDASIVEYIEASGAGDDFLRKFEMFVSQQKVSFFSEELDFKMQVPVTIIVCEGDIETIAHISWALNKRLPVIIIKGSGKAADLILNYLDNPDVLRKKATLLLGINFDKNTYDVLTMLLKSIKKNEDMIGVFDVDNDDPLMLSNIVGEAVINCWEKNLTGENENIQENRSVLSATGSSLTRTLVKEPERDIHNQLLLDYMDSRPHVLNPKYASPTSLPLSFYFFYQQLQKSGSLMDLGGILLLEAMKANRCDYVKILLDQRVQLENLPQLYAKTVSCEKCENHAKKEECHVMYQIFKGVHEPYTMDLCDEYISVMNDLKSMKNNSINAQGQQFKDAREYENDIREIKTCKVPRAARGLCLKILGYKEKSETQESEKHTAMNTCDAEKNDKGDASNSDLLLWAIFANRRELAEICWLRGKDHLLTGLICSVLLRTLSNKIKNAKNDFLSSEFEEHSKLFEQRCLAIMDCMCKENPKHAIELMDDESVVWGIQSSPLTFAYENFMYDVVAHTCSQKNMDERWYNKIAGDLVPFLKEGFHDFRTFKSLLTSPGTKYIYNYFMFFCVLMMYSTFVLTSIGTEFYAQGIAKGFEYYMYFWTFGDFIEELFCCFGLKGHANRGCCSRMKRYLHDFWNKVDLFSYVLLVIALCVRHAHPSDTFTIARRMFSFSLLVMYLRFLEIFLIHRQLGPTVIMIKEMY